MTLPYANASSGQAARAEIVKILQRLGCSQIGFMDDFATNSVMLAFEWRGRKVSMQASAI